MLSKVQSKKKKSSTKRKILNLILKLSIAAWKDTAPSTPSCKEEWQTSK
tara:strand:- start:419 stop:565 length:147 start_codon:yes stop_codon:yes gene_type:complete